MVLGDAGWCWVVLCCAGWLGVVWCNVVVVVMKGGGLSSW